LVILIGFGLFVLTSGSRGAEAGCRGYIQFRAVEVSARGLPLPLNEHGVRNWQRSSVAASVMDQEVPCHGPQCQAPPQHAPMPTVPLGIWPNSQSADATLSLSSDAAPTISVTWFVPFHPGQISRSTLDRLDRPPRV
jgi:hypothetical protein